MRIVGVGVFLEGQAISSISEDYMPVVRENSASDALRSGQNFPVVLSSCLVETGVVLYAVRFMAFIPLLAGRYGESDGMCSDECPTCSCGGLLSRNGGGSGAFGEYARVRSGYGTGHLGKTYPALGSGAGYIVFQIAAEDQSLRANPR